MLHNTITQVKELSCSPPNVTLCRDLEEMVHRVQLDLLVNVVCLVIQDCLASLDHKVCVVMMVLPVALESLACLVHKVLMVPKETGETLEFQV